ncbi:putative non-specific serine/threonine protein kinase [Helianthus debilis subsp. tardiflorus]
MLKVSLLILRPIGFEGCDRMGAVHLLAGVCLIRVMVDLGPYPFKVLPEKETIGFSGSTGFYAEKHTIRYWNFSSSLMTIEEREDVVALTSISNKLTKLEMGLAVPLCVLVIVGIVAYFIFWRRRGKAIQESEDVVALASINDDDLDRGTGPKRFPLRDLALATNNFSSHQKFGEGGFGCVYKGYLSREGIMVAVKKNSQGSKQGRKST